MGLVVGLLALRQATRAARSAKDASEQVRQVRSQLAQRTAAEELGNLTHSMNLVMARIEENKVEPAKTLLAQAKQQIYIITTRHKGRLSEEQSNRLNQAAQQIKSAIKELSRTNPDAECFSLCRVAIQKASDSIVNAEGIALAVTDGQ